MHYGPGVDSACNRNEYQEYFLGIKSDRCVRLTTLPSSCDVVTKFGNLNFLEPSGHLGTAMGLLYLFYYLLYVFRGLLNHLQEVIGDKYMHRIFSNLIRTSFCRFLKRKKKVKFDVWLTVHRSSMWNKKPTRCHLVLYLFLLYKLARNMLSNL